MLKTIHHMLHCFQTYGIEFCHWKSNEHLMEALDGDTDLDILFKPSQRNLMEKALSESGLKRFRAMPLMQYNAIEDYIGFDQETAKIWHLHVHYRLTFGEKHLKGYTAPWEKYLLHRSTLSESGDIYCSNPADEYFLLLIRMALKLRWRDLGSAIGCDDIKELKWLQERTSVEEVKNVAHKLLNQTVADEIENLLCSTLERKNQLLKLQKILRTEMKLLSSYNRTTSFIKRTQRETSWLIDGLMRRAGWNSRKAYRRISPAGGILVAIVGCDGSGKSTTINYIKKEFGKKIDVYSTYLGSGDGSSSIMRWPMKLVAKRVGGRGLGQEVEKEQDSNRKLSLKAKAYTFAKIIWGVTLAFEKKKKLKKITRARNAGLLVLVDRYPQTDVQGYNDGPILKRYRNNNKRFMRKLSDWEFNIYNSANLNPPDLLVKLVIPTEIAIKRKPEMTIEEIENKKAAVHKMRICERCVEIDTSQDIKVSLGQVMNEIWKGI